MTSLSSVAATADMTRSLVTTLPPVFIGVAYLYHKGVIEGRDASWGATDLVIVTAVAYATTSFGVSNRWGGS